MKNLHSYQVINIQNYISNELIAQKSPSETEAHFKQGRDLDQISKGISWKAELNCSNRTKIIQKVKKGQRGTKLVGVKFVFFLVTFIKLVQKIDLFFVNYQLSLQLINYLSLQS